MKLTGMDVVLFISSFQRIFRLSCFHQVVQKQKFSKVRTWTVIRCPVMPGIFTPKILQSVNPSSSYDR